jgi:hypothetical protein
VLDVFVVLSGTFSIAATFPLLFLAVRSSRDGRNLRQLQLEVADLMLEVTPAASSTTSPSWQGPGGACPGST